MHVTISPSARSEAAAPTSSPGEDAALLEGAFASAGVGLCLLDPTGRILRANERWLETAGLSAREALGRDIWELFPGAALEFQTLHDRVRAGESMDVPAHRQVLGGREVWYEGRLAPVRMAHGTGILITAIDVTERVRSRHALERERSRLAHGYELASALSTASTATEVARVVFEEGLAAFDADAGALALADEEPGWLRLAAQRGYPEGLIAAWRRFPVSVASPVTDCYRDRASVWVESPEAAAARYPEWSSAVAGQGDRAWAGIPLEVAGRVLGAVGLSYRRARAFTSEDRAYANSIANLCAQALERARLLESERAARAVADTRAEELTASEQRFRTVTEHLPDVIARFDREFRHTFVTGAVREATGLAPERLLGKTNAELSMPPELTRQWDADLAAVFASGEARAIEFPFDGPGGRKWYEARLVPERDGAAVRSVLAVTRDVTAARTAAWAEREARREAERVGEMQRLVMGVVSHDLRGPLQTIKMSATVLVRKGGLSDEQAERVLRISRAAERVGGIIRDLLDYTRARQGEALAIDPVDTAVEDLAKGIVLDTHSDHSHRDITFASTGPCRACVDPGRFGQVLMNLLGNALQHGSPTCRVRVSLEETDGEVQLSVANDGAPIPPSVQAELFEPFRRGGERQDRSGLGLGLFIVREIARAHRGDVTVTSTHENGTTFIVRFPKERSASADR
jgi:PAS domain S-box-containing protein